MTMTEIQRQRHWQAMEDIAADLAYNQRHNRAEIKAIAESLIAAMQAVGVPLKIRIVVLDYARFHQLEQGIKNSAN